jgi:hypothetical protein
LELSASRSGNALVNVFFRLPSGMPAAWTRRVSNEPTTTNSAKENRMKRTNVAVAAASLLIAATAHAEQPRDEIQAPRGQEIRAPRGQEIQAPRGQEIQAPRL